MLEYEFREGFLDGMEAERARSCSALPGQACEECRTRCECYRKQCEEYRLFEERIEEGKHQHLCKPCEEKLKARFGRDGRGWDGTFAGVLDAERTLGMAWVSEWNAELHDSDAQLVRELFPGIEPPRPMHKKWMRLRAAIVDVLRRVGKPIAYFDPHFGQDGHFVLFSLDGEAGYTVVMCDTLSLVDAGDVACALELAPDGTPQENPTYV